jgi:hypothetical protein
MRSLLIIFAVIAGCACSKPANSPTVDASDAAPSTETQICGDLSDAGCAIGTDCVNVLDEDKIPGGFATLWAACLFSGAPVTSCKVPCAPPSE